MIAWFKDLFDKMMTLPEVNSRVVFFIQGFASSVAVLILTIGFVIAKDKTSYQTMLAAAGGGGFAAALGRFFTKSGDGKQNDTGPKP